MKHIFIINPIAGKGNRVDILKEKIKKTFSSESYVIEITKRKAEATIIAKRYASTKADMIIYACGGDGTLNEVVNGMYEYPNAKLAIIPIGTGNDFVKTLSYSIEEISNLDNYHDIKMIPCDLIDIDHYASINTASIGLDVEIAKNVTKFKKLPFKKETIPYYSSLLYSMMTSLSHTYTIIIDDKEEIRGEFTFIVGCNGRHYGGGYMPSPKAIINDGIIDLLTINKVSRAKILQLAKAYEKGTHLQYPKIATLRHVKKFQVLYDKPLFINVDGEIIERINPTMQIKENAITLVLPNI